MNKTYLMTGATGFLGSQLSKKILADGDNIIFIGKSKHDSTFEERIHALFPQAREEQLLCVEADLESITLEELLTSISRFNKKIDGIWHLAANLSFKESDKAKVFQTNIQGVAKMIGLAKSLDSILFHTSTAFIHGRNSGISKEEFGPKPLHFNNPYEESKYEAEQQVKNAEGLKFMIFRPSIMYDTHAEYVTNFGYYSFLIALFKFKKNLGLKTQSRVFVPFPFLCYKKSRLNLMPTDKAIEWMHTISKKDDSQGLIFHICNPKPFVILDIFKQTFTAFNIKMPVIGVPAAVAYTYFRLLDLIAFLIKPLRPIAQRIYYFKGYLLKHMYYDMTNTRKALAYDIDPDFNVPKNHIYDLATAVIAKLEVYKKKQ